MLQAILKGKLSREEERMEDLLTSCVFGILKYTFPDQILIPFLQLARNPLTDESITHILDGAKTIESIDFWPFLSGEGCHPCEPDVDITMLHEDGSKSRLLIEAKYLSGKSSFPAPLDEKPCDQIAREFDNLSKISLKKGIKKFAVIYLTADYFGPVQDIKQSVDEYAFKRNQKPNIFWLSWRKLSNFLEEANIESSGMLNDVSLLLEYLNLNAFIRLRYQEVANNNWRFIRDNRNWSWKSQPITWRFRKHTRDWKYKLLNPRDYYKFES